MIEVILVTVFGGLFTFLGILTAPDTSIVQASGAATGAMFFCLILYSIKFFPQTWINLFS